MSLWHYAAAVRLIHGIVCRAVIGTFVLVVDGGRVERPRATLTDSRVGEVVATSIAEFEAQSVTLHQIPPLGALVRVRVDGGGAIYGVVAGAQTVGVDAGVRPVPRGRDGCEDAEIYRDNPDLAYVLRTSFQCLVVGYGVGGAIYYHLPAAPAPIHYSVLACPPNECEQFSASLAYFRVILAARNAPIEEVLAAHIRFLASSRRDQARAFCVRAGREVALLLRADHVRAATILQHIRPALTP